LTIQSIAFLNIYDVYNFALSQDILQSFLLVVLLFPFLAFVWLKVIVFSDLKGITFSGG
jgi:hypothetical protein